MTGQLIRYIYAQYTRGISPHDVKAASEAMELRENRGSARGSNEVGWKPMQFRLENPAQQEHARERYCEMVLKQSQIAIELENRRQGSLRADASVSRYFSFGSVLRRLGFLGVRGAEQAEKNPGRSGLDVGTVALRECTPSQYCWPRGCGNGTR